MADDRTGTFLRMIRRSGRGRLKIYLGYGAGVGKTYQMLLEGHRLRDEGIDVVVGFVEAHGRRETSALVDGLEVVSRRKQEYRGVVLEEMDRDAVLARKPQVALIDELAHTNVPGSLNPKRYQDVQDILDAGIHVITTLNIQHLESLYDTVEREIHVRIRERIPDTVVAEADQIVNVDLSTEDLRKRLEEGKIYPADRVQTALGNFFTGANLENLRELTLRELASHIDLKRRETTESEAGASPDQVMVALSSRGPNSEMLLRYASRLAGRLNRNWYAVYVQTPSEAPTVIDSQTQRMLSGTLTLAKQLGAMVFTYKGEDIVDTLLRFAKEYRAGTLVVGSPRIRPWWKRIRGEKSAVERLLHAASGLTIVVLDTRAPVAKSPPPVPRASPAIPAGAVPVPEARAEEPQVGDLLTPRRVVIWNQPVQKALVLRMLVDVAAEGGAAGDPAAILDTVLEREALGTTFINEGVAFPHARLEKLTRPVVAVGLTHGGISDVSTDAPVEVVFLILTPLSDPAIQVRILGLISRAVRNRELMRKLIAARSGEEVLAAITAWESMG
ncbi:MAG TPA: PTS sugar transporter subunit IIA [Candidatus Deferrimicrobiaceae bacterium]|jgi:two-component system sensor histidine kinase KdpD